jgi:hypothetical protein
LTPESTSPSEDSCKVLHISRATLYQYIHIGGGI